MRDSCRHVSDMAVQRPPVSLGAEETRVPLAPPAPLRQAREDLHPLGETLKAQAEDVVKETVARTIAPGQVVDALIQDSFERICASSTMAVASWIAGGDIRAAREAGREAWQIFGELE